MNHIKSIKSVMAMMVMLLFVVGCAASSTATTGTAAKAKAKPKPYDPTGTWEYTVEIPDGGFGGTLVVTGNPGAYAVTLETDEFGALETTEVSMDGQTMTGYIEVMMGNYADIECTFDGETFTGLVYLGEDAFPMEGKRVSK